MFDLPAELLYIYLGESHCFVMLQPTASQPIISNDDNDLMCEVFASAELMSTVV